MKHGDNILNIGSTRYLCFIEVTFKPLLLLSSKGFFCSLKLGLSSMSCPVFHPTRQKRREVAQSEKHISLVGAMLELATPDLMKLTFPIDVLKRVSGMTLIECPPC